MRHVLLLGTPATGTGRMVHAPATAGLVAPAGGALRVAPCLLCTAARTVDLAAVAAAADQHLSLAASAYKQPRCRCLRLGQCRTWTRAATGGILPRHACPARCGARRRYETWPLRSAPCLPIRQVVTAPSVRSNPRHGPLLDRAARTSLWICGQRKSVAHRPTGAETAARFNLMNMKRRASQPCLPHPGAVLGLIVRDFVTTPLRHLCADPRSRSHESIATVYARCF
jgi:hypothetical protein